MVYRRGVYGVLWGDPRKGDHLAVIGVDGVIILKWIFKKEGRHGLDYSGSE